MSKSSHSNYALLLTWGNQSHSHVLSFGGEIHFMWQDFCFDCVFEKIFSGHNKLGGTMLPRYYGCEGSPDYQSSAKRIIRKDEPLCPHCQLG